MLARRKPKLFCSFCRKNEDAVAALIAGPGVHICEACVGLCNAILAGEETPGFAGWASLSEETLLAALAPSERSVEAAREVLKQQIEVLRSRNVSWASIGEALGVSRQAAWERFG